MGKAENVRLTVFYIHIFSTGGNNWLKLQLTRTWQTENYWIDPLTTDLDQFFNNIWPYILYDVILEILTLSDPDTFQFGNFLIFINSNNFIFWQFPILYHLWHFHILTLSDFEKFGHFQILTHSDCTFRFGPKKGFWHLQIPTPSDSDTFIIYDLSIYGIEPIQSIDVCSLAAKHWMKLLKGFVYHTYSWTCGMYTSSCAKYSSLPYVHPRRLGYTIRS